MASDRPVIALRTPLYLILAALGVVIFVATFLPWVTVDTQGATMASGVAESATGLDAGGWGASAIVVGLIIAAIGVIGYFVNPFSDPEALFIAGFAVATIIAAFAKIGDSATIMGTDIVDYYDATTGIGLWLILVCAIAALVGAAWIVVSRPSAETRLID